MEPASSTNQYHYNPSLIHNARKLRKNMTKSEVVLWKYALKAGRAHGFKFDRQRPVLDYIADFMCRPLLLIIEVDGAYHLLEDVQKKDAIRQRRLESVGFHFLRLPLAYVLDDIKQATATVHDTVLLRAEELGVGVSKRE